MLLVLPTIGLGQSLLPRFTLQWDSLAAQNVEPLNLQRVFGVICYGMTRRPGLRWALLTFLTRDRILQPGLSRP